MKSAGYFKETLDAVTAKSIADIVSDASGTLPAAIKAVAIQAETADVRFRDDGTAPDATTGMLLKTGLNPIFWQSGCQKLKFIGTAAAKLHITLYT